MFVFMFGLKQSVNTLPLPFWLLLFLLFILAVYWWMTKLSRVKTDMISMYEWSQNLLKDLGAWQPSSCSYEDELLNSYFAKLGDWSEGTEDAFCHRPSKSGMPEEYYQDYGAEKERQRKISELMASCTTGW